MCPCSVLRAECGSAVGEAGVRGVFGSPALG